VATIPSSGVVVSAGQDDLQVKASVVDSIP
jgi:hypothetical protein